MASTSSTVSRPEHGSELALGEVAKVAILDKMNRGPNLVVRIVGDGALVPCGPEMDPVLWSQLPWEMMVLRILPSLPRLSQLRFRLVCREWRRLLSLPGLLRHNFSGALLCAYRVQPGGSGRQQQEQQLPLPRNTVCTLNLWKSVPNYGDSYFRQALSHSRLDVDKHSVAGQDGVLCIQVRTDVDAYWDNPRRREIRDVFFVNPMTNTWRRVEKSGWPDLPGCNVWDKVHLGRAKVDVGCSGTPAGTTADPERSSFRLLYGCSLRDSLYQGWITCVYNGDSQAWDNTERSLRPLLLSDERVWFDPVQEGSVICNATLFAYDGKDQRLFVHQFDTGAYEWQSAPVPGVSHTPKFHLLERYGSVFFVGLSASSCPAAHSGSGSGRQQLQGFHICRLAQGPGPAPAMWVWELVAAMPAHVVAQVMSCFQGEPDWSIDDFEACAAGHCLLLIFRSCSKLQFVGFDLQKHSWQFGFPGEDPKELATYDGFFEARLDLHLYNGSESDSGRTGNYAPFGYESGAGFVFACGLRPPPASSSKKVHLLHW